MMLSMKGQFERKRCLMVRYHDDDLKKLVYLIIILKYFYIFSITNFNLYNYLMYL